MFFTLKRSLQGVAVLTPKPKQNPLPVPLSVGAAGTGRADKAQALAGPAARAERGLPRWRPYTALCPKKAREFRSQCWSTSIQFATFRVSSVLRATDLKHYWVEGSETQVPFTVGQAQQLAPPGDGGWGTRDGGRGTGRVTLMKSCL